MARTTVAALYDNLEAATRAVRELEESSFNPRDISLIANNAETGEAGDGPRRAVGSVSRDTATAAPEGAGTGAAIGALLGGGASLLAAAGALAIPGIGPVLAAGPLAAALAGAGVGAAAGGLIGGLIGLGVPEEEAQRYAEAVRRGGAIVAVKLDGGADAAGRATRILERHQPVDLEERSTAWRRGGWQRFDAGAEPLPPSAIRSEREQWRAATAAPATGAMSAAAGVSGEGAAGQRPPQRGDAVARAEPLRPDPDREERIAAEIRRLHQDSLIEAEAQTAEMRGGPVPTAMSEEPGSAEAASRRRDELRPQDEPLKRQADTGALRVRSYTSDGIPLREAIDRAAAGDKPRGVEGSDPLADHSRERG
jgi:hypothetical protein